MSTLALIIMSLATAVKASTYQNRTELATYDEIYSAVMDKGLKVQYELNISAFNFGPISADLTNIEWFSNYSVNAQLHGNREYMAFSEIEPTFLGLNESWPYHIDMERVETVLNVLTFYGPDTKVQDWSRITYYKKEQTVVGSDGTTFSFDVLVQARVEVLMGSDPDLGLTDNG